MKHRNTPSPVSAVSDNSITLQPEEQNIFTEDRIEEDVTPEIIYEKDLGSAEEGKEKGTEKILQTITSLNKEKTDGLDLLLPEEEGDIEKEEEDSGVTKKIV